MSEAPSPPLGRPGPAPAPSLNFLSLVQHNCLGSWSVFTSLFNSLRAAPIVPSFVFVQDPPVFRNRLPTFGGFKLFAPSFASGCAPRVACYAALSILQSFPILPCFFDRLDLMALDVHTPSGLFDSTQRVLRLYNGYSTNGRSAAFRTIPPEAWFPSHDFPCLVVGDFNLHHPLSDPLRQFSPHEIRLSSPYFQRASDEGFVLLNTPGVFTRFPFNGATRPGVLDLSFANSLLAPYFVSWSADLPATGSDHIPIVLKFSAPLLRPPAPSPNWSKTDWDTLRPGLRELLVPPPPLLPTASSLSSWFDRHLTRVTTLLLANTPLKRPSLRSKPWWSATLSHLRQDYHMAMRVHRAEHSPATLSESKARRLVYFKAIKRAKSAHWNAFLSKIGPMDVWNARRIAAGRPDDRFPSLPGSSTPEAINSALLSHFFPPKPAVATPQILRPFAHVSPLSAEEVSLALSRSSNTSAPGPDQIPYSVWKAVNEANPQILLSLLSPLLTFGFHPPSLKKANGIVLSKPGKSDYSSPASFRIIVLLQTVSKILERIAASRLSQLARSSGLINRNQCGSLSGLSTFDACAALSHEVRTIQRPGLKASTLFLDIKGGFDNISSTSLVSLLRSRGIPGYLCSWVRSFLTDRKCRLVFQGSPDLFSPVQVGTPQGSPVSPLLFVIYVSVLHLSIPRGIMFSYVDDFTLTVGSLSYRRNCQIFQRLFSILKRRAARIGVSFSVPKTELCHWRTPRDRAPPSHDVVALDGAIFRPSSTVRWLGYWFTSNLHTTAHFDKRLALAQGAFGIIRQLSPAGKGLSPHANRRLASGLILPILSYGADLFVPNTSTLDKMTVFWNKVLRWVTNCFRSTPVTILSCEACLPPLDCYLPHKRRMAALRMVCSSPHINPATARISSSFPLHSAHRAEDSLAHLLRGVRQNYIPLKWNQDKPVPAVRSHLPIDDLCHSLCPLARVVCSFPLIHPHLLPITVNPPGDPPPGRSYAAIKAILKDSLLREWQLQSPPPVSYRFRPTLTPHPFMGLDRFTAGRIHQMRAGKSYLAAHPNWGDTDPILTCPWCEEAPETFAHAVLHCSAKSDARARHLPGVRSVSPASPLWQDRDLVLGLAQYIRSTGTAFPPEMPPQVGWPARPCPSESQD